jgi:hypothetical protein
MVVLIVVAVSCFAAGSYAAARWLPALADGTVGAIAFFVVCGLAGVAVALIGVNVDSIVRQLEETGLRRSGEFEVLVVSSGLVSILRDSGTVAALALVAYLLAPKPPRSEPAPAAEAGSAEIRP